ncbi:MULTISPECIES: hypothetical protein [unclassified Corynebacterium]|uniref:hypothetical protein n=1 Tax=unclassified Corynebacterium TaxID=2624378 RepID=UPI0029C9CBA4|nr:MULTISPECIES: hypothetical protein [unclassified Corynebacterium]WPF66917.1 hypothetical protein OLX12_04115 [Corynebacterium sp. 22KM0430]WPF69404.1 hypothetical protein OLW90_04110 [Corynebacterium sp. 21KM1197]
MKSRAGYIDRSKLKAWADTRRAESEFPRLIRRLILETTPGLVQLGMPAGEGVAAGDWDGFVQAAEATAWVPDGSSAWELSVNSSPNRKANEDYSKRRKTPDGTPTAGCTYIEAILRPWTTRNEWAKNKRNDQIWRDVKAFGLDDIETWLETAPITWAWFSEELGFFPHGICTGLTWWRNWASQTNPALTPEVVLAGRTDTARNLEERLSSVGSITTVAGASIEEVCAFIAATAVSLDSKGGGQMLARLAFVDDVSTWRQLTTSGQSLILVPCTPELASEIPAGTVHNICVPVTFNEGADVSLSALDAAEVAVALTSVGATDKDKADELGRLARRSLTALRRNLAVKAVLHRPAWAGASLSRNFRSILLAGSLEDNVEGDRSILEILAGTDYELFREAITGIADNAADPLVIRTSESWHLVSPVSAWKLLVSNLNCDDIKRFEVVVNMVLAEVDPALVLPLDQRWRALIEGKTRRYSKDLRCGLARSIALLAIYGETIIVPGGVAGSDFANYLVKNLLELASMDDTGEAWQSLADILPLLAEAGPDAFLDVVSAEIAGDSPLLSIMFQDDADKLGIFSSGILYRNLLCALECVSWSPDHFGRAVFLLAGLDEIDPGGNMANRSAASLAAIFCPWYPGTSVDSDRRIAVLDILRRRYPDAAWKLECSMLPDRNDMHFQISAPVFRTWKPDDSSVTYGEFRKMTTFAVKRCIEDAGEDAQRWSTILSRTVDLPETDRALVVYALESMADRPQITDEFREKVWRTLVDLIGYHREFSDATWTLPGGELDKLDALAARYQPESAYACLVGLFQSWNPYIKTHKQDDDEAYDCELKRRRVEAVEMIEAEEGFDAIMRLARDALVPGAVGISLANFDSLYDDALLSWLASADLDLVRTAIEYFSARYSVEGFSLVENLLKRDGLAVDQRARILLVASDNLTEAWALVAVDPDLETCYWEEFNPFVLSKNLDKIDEILEYLIRAGRHTDVLYLMSVYFSINKGGPRPQVAQLIVRALEGLLADQARSAAACNLSSSHFQRIFTYLETMRDHLEPDCLVRLQWSYLRVLGYNARVPALSESLAADPAKFVELVCTVYRAQSGDEGGEMTEDPAGKKQRDASLVSNAYRLLNAWDTPPGLVDGVMNAEVLQAWLDRAMELLAERGRTEVGLQHIGQVLGHTPPDADGTWPGNVVRDLIEEVQLEYIETGLYLYIVNGRGVTSRGLEDGGYQELKLAEEYRDKAQAFVDVAPRVAGLLKRVAVAYENEARRNEESAERFRCGFY